MKKIIMAILLVILFVSGYFSYCRFVEYQQEQKHIKAGQLVKSADEDITGKDYISALEKLDSAEKLAPDNYRVYELRALVMYKTDNPAEMLKNLKKAEALHPDNPDFYYVLGNMMLNLKDYRSAFSAFNKVLEYKPDHGGAIHHRGDAYYYMGALKKAEKDWKYALHSDPAGPIGRQVIPKLKLLESVMKHRPKKLPSL